MQGMNLARVVYTCIYIYITRERERKKERERERERLMEDEREMKEDRGQYIYSGYGYVRHHCNILPYWMKKCVLSTFFMYIYI